MILGQRMKEKVRYFGTYNLWRKERCMRRVKKMMIRRRRRRRR